MKITASACAGAVSLSVVFLCEVCLHIELFISEIKSNINGNLDEVKNIEKEAEIEDEA